MIFKIFLASVFYWLSVGEEASDCPRPPPGGGQWNHWVPTKVQPPHRAASISVCRKYRTPPNLSALRLTNALDPNVGLKVDFINNQFGCSLILQYTGTRDRNSTLTLLWLSFFTACLVKKISFFCFHLLKTDFFLTDSNFNRWLK